MDWFEFGLAFVVFFATHSIPVRPSMKAKLVSRFGARGFTIGYSGLSLAAVSWLIYAVGRAPYAQLWPWSPWQPYLAVGVMLAACLSLSLSLGRPNPFSFGGKNGQGFDPSNPGIVRLTRHPLLMVLLLWSLAHLIANGDLAHGLLFGIFAGFAAFGTTIIDRRKRRTMGARWQAIWSEVRANPLSVAIPANKDTGVRLICGVILFAALLGLHRYVIGVSPIP